MAGKDGKDGKDGQAATIQIGTVTTLPPGQQAVVANSGTPNAAVLEFEIPAGAKGDKGDAATVTVGSTTQASWTEGPTVQNSGTPNAAVLDFSIPQGRPGTGGAPFWDYANLEDVTQRLKDDPAGLTYTAEDYGLVQYVLTVPGVTTVYVDLKPAGAADFIGWRIAQVSGGDCDIRGDIPLSPGDSIRFRSVSAAMPTTKIIRFIPPLSYAAPFVDWQATPEDLLATGPVEITTQSLGKASTAWFEAPFDCSISFTVKAGNESAKFVLVRPSGPVSEDTSLKDPVLERDVFRTVGGSPSSGHVSVYARKGEWVGLAAYQGSDPAADLASVLAYPVSDGRLSTYPVGYQCIPNWSAYRTIPTAVESILVSGDQTYKGITGAAPANGVIVVWCDTTSGIKCDVMAIKGNSLIYVGNLVNKNPANALVPVGKGDKVMLAAGNSGNYPKSVTMFFVPTLDVGTSSTGEPSEPEYPSTRWAIDYDAEVSIETLDVYKHKVTASASPGTTPPPPSTGLGRTYIKIPDDTDCYCTAYCANGRVLIYKVKNRSVLDLEAGSNLTNWSRLIIAPADISLDNLAIVAGSRNTAAVQNANTDVTGEYVGWFAPRGTEYIAVSSVCLTSTSNWNSPGRGYQNNHGARTDSAISRIFAYPIEYAQFQPPRS